jgi:hypothetical protein
VYPEEITKNQNIIGTIKMEDVQESTHVCFKDLPEVLRMNLYQRFAQHFTHNLTLKTVIQINQNKSTAQMEKKTRITNRGFYPEIENSSAKFLDKKRLSVKVDV